MEDTSTAHGQTDLGQQAHDDESLTHRILDAFDGNIKRVRIPVTYRLGILLVAIAMVLLPLVYLGVIWLVGVEVYAHAVSNTDMLKSARGRGALTVVLLYLAPIIIGTILIIFMLKPFFSRPAKRHKPRSITREEEPLLFAFVDRICEAVHAPKPSQINVDCEVNASASFRRGFLSMFGNDLVLTIGLPLVAGLNSRQFAGVLAHEFGHFAQGFGMRLTYVIRTINRWFHRVVYERDSWDEQLVAYSKGIDFRVGWVLYLARLLVWLTRTLLWILMIVGHVISCYMLRQMEYDADLHQTRLAGSEAFESTFRRLAVLSFGSIGAQSDLADFHREGRLGDDLPQLIISNVNQLSEDLQAEVEKIFNDSKTGIFATHPSDPDRIAQAKKENAPGLFRLEVPSTSLFQDFHATSKASTWKFYEESFGSDVKPEDLHPIEELLKRQAHEQEAFNALERFCLGAFQPHRPFLFPETDLGSLATIECQQLTNQLMASRDGVSAGVAAYKNAQEADAEDDSDSQPNDTADSVVFEKTMSRRLFTALSLLQSEEFSKPIEQRQDLQRETAELLPILHLLEGRREQLSQIVAAHALMAELFQRLSNGQGDEKLMNRTRDHLKAICGLLEDLKTSLQDQKYPFDHANPEITIWEVAVAKFPENDDPAAINEAVGSVLKTIPRIYSRVVGRLCIAAEKVEAALGLPPLPEPV